MTTLFKLWIASVILILILFPLLPAISIAENAAGNHGNTNDDQGVAEFRPAHVLVISIDGFHMGMLSEHTTLLPNISALAERGVQAEGLIPTNPTLTWPNHTSMVTGSGSARHSVLFNGMVQRTNGSLPLRFEASLHKESLVAARTVYDDVFEAGKTAAAINWPGTVGATALRDNLPDAPDPIGNASEELLWDLFDDGLLDDFTSFALWQYDHAGRDTFWASAAGWLITNRMPELLLLHLLNLDSMLHRNATDSQEALDALVHTDELVGLLLRQLKDAGLYEQTAVFLVSDHGMTNTPQTLLPNRVLQQHGLLEVNEKGRIAGGRAEVFANGGFAMVYFQNPWDTALIEETAQLFEQTTGIERVVREADFEAFGLPDPQQHPQAGQLALFSSCGTAMNNAVITRTHQQEFIVPSAGNDFALAHHGFLNECDCMSGVFIAYGKGILSELRLEAFSIESLAPTIALLLDVPFESAEAQPLYQVLVPAFRTEQVTDSK
ncbi:MAG: ectonucleotide pyrophosphatase/phosphodiesterase [Candidatus Cyclonatronum sp.]|uniref:alkaline phosphatase family protein n=1 Tax=Cyclonatronum sp. TaxID=3024185 RepID=UPI0025C666F9|nr:ectonucleotide pyrophosphatase/phosphodiesterase [Cyclonatronum sp.]MCH8486006.1 ectonucleotide pyrophosphatase/phosphodiesterase [Cyclonatronum sp.]